MGTLAVGCPTCGPRVGAGGAEGVVDGGAEGAADGLMGALDAFFDMNPVYMDWARFQDIFAAAAPAAAAAPVEVIDLTVDYVDLT